MTRAIRFADVYFFLTFLLLGPWAALEWGLSARFWFDPRTVYVLDAAEGDEVEMIFDRSIYREFRGTYVVTIRRVGTEEVICEAHGGSNYKPGASLPKPLTLSWWAFTEPRCHGPNLPVGTFQIETTWAVKRPWGVLSDKTVPITSNPFTIYSAEQKKGETL